MRIAILIISLLVSLASHAQVDYFTLTKSSGMLIGMVEHRAPANPNGKLNPTLVWLHGIDANRFQAVGKGSTNPVADNSTEAGRQLNRRTDIKVILAAE